MKQLQIKNEGEENSTGSLLLHFYFLYHTITFYITP